VLRIYSSPLHNALDARVTVQRQGNRFVSSAVFQEQIPRILKDGVDSGIYRIRQINLAAKSVLEAMVGFGHPDRVTKFAGDPRTSDVRRLFRLLNAGLKSGVVLSTLVPLVFSVEMALCLLPGQPTGLANSERVC